MICRDQYTERSPSWKPRWAPLWRGWEAVHEEETLALNCTLHISNCSAANESYFPSKKNCRKPDKNARQKMHVNALLCCSKVIVLHNTDQCSDQRGERNKCFTTLLFIAQCIAIYQHNWRCIWFRQGLALLTKNERRAFVNKKKVIKYRLKD